MSDDVRPGIFDPAHYPEDASEQRRSERELAAPSGSADFVLRCSCGQVLSFQTNKRGRLSKAGKTLAGLFRHFHEAHGGTVEVLNEQGECERCMATPCLCAAVPAIRQHLKEQNSD